MYTRLLTVAALSTIVGGCASYSTPLQGEFTDITPHQSMVEDRTGSTVRWGGRVVSTEPLADRTCFEILSTQLDGTGRPQWAVDDTRGRFIACRAGFYDPALFTEKREITFTGRIEGYETRKIGEYDYRFPRIAADVVYLWPVRDDRTTVIVRSTWPWWGVW